MKWGTGILTAAVILAAAGSAVRTSYAQGRQGSTPQEDVLPALLTEVRGLREAMEQMASAGPRVQLALGRVQLQEQRVNNLLRRVEESRSHLLEAQRNYERLQQDARAIEASLRDPKPDGPPLPQLQAVQRETARELSRVSDEVQRLTGEVSSMDTDLATEQARWLDLNQRMETLEQSLIRR